jgi:[acyl-carrier-protein] S-malonyltransferase
MVHKLALVFPGQGSQYVGMGLDLYDQYSEARSVFDEADRTLGFGLTRLCFEGPEDELNDTVNTQAAVLTVSVATLRAMGNLGRAGQVSSVAGHSLGEYTALVAAGRVSYADAVRLVRERGRLMKEAGEQRPGGMAAVLGLPEETVAQACQQAQEDTGTVIQVANYNSPGQIVVSGERSGLDRAAELLKEQGARRVVQLAVSIPSHCTLMESAAEGLRGALSKVVFRDTDTPVVGNVTGRPLQQRDEIREELVRQLVSPVQWVSSVRWMIDQGVKTFVEIGPKDTLSNLIKRIDGSAARISVNSAAAVDAWRNRAMDQRPAGGE